MRLKLLLFAVLLALNSAAGGQQRIGHTTLTPRHTSPDDKGMYAAVIDPANGYAYFFGNYMFKLDITGNLPVQVGPALQALQYSEGAIDPAAGYCYMPRVSLNRYALGAGTNPPTSAGTLTLAEGAPSSVVIDDSDLNPANHYAYVACSGTPARIVKVALSTFTEVSSLTLNPGENAFSWGRIDSQKGYAYFANSIVYTSPMIPQVLKIKLTPGTNAPIRLGVVDIGATPVALWTSSIDTVHGFLFYATDSGNLHGPETFFKVRVGDGDALPSPVPFGGVNFRTNEIQIISQVVDPAGGYVYCGCDNTFPGRVYQFAINGTNPPVEIGYLQFQGGTNTTPQTNGVTASNIAGDGTNLPFGEVFFRSAVFDPVRGYAYFGQDSRPNQVVKVQLELDVPVISNSVVLAGGAFQLNFACTPGVSYTALAATNPALPLTNWTVLGPATEVSTGQFQFTDLQATNNSTRFYRIRSP